MDPLSLLHKQWTAITNVNADIHCLLVIIPTNLKLQNLREPFKQRNNCVEV